MKKIQNLIGQKFGRLTILEFIERKENKTYWKCQCDCGNIIKTTSSQLKSGKTKSCGCLRKEIARENAICSKSTYHLSKTKIYNVWRSIKKRCYLKTHIHYKNYGGRGIIMCDEWKNDFMSFYNWAMANGYKEGLTIDRIDVNGNYEPNNCRWVTIKEQENNKRNNILLTYKNITKNIYEWSKITGIKYCTIWWRYNNNWSIEKILQKGAKYAIKY